MKNLLALIFLTLISISVWADNTGAINDAKNWLQVIDREKYLESWDNSGPLFQQYLTRDSWSEKLASVRKPLGSLLLREMQSVTETNSLPGAPDGNYSVVVFDSQFEHVKKASETVTLQKVGGNWMAIGYYIR
ncbi:DUF4019 domain-containing protein [uncultured Microbulbifer sp.]|uniref:DUF4019 domain-containing protein n=1 Tax=uncultured Microbulbifer sp. TaxID=348147 RepID=UPI00262A3B77|nr:DUF4019 domain-containing protein [uncultured Microbulbifer sp.]